MTADQVRRRRKARIAFGWVLSLAGPMWLLSMLGPVVFPDSAHGELMNVPTVILVGVWVFGLAFMVFHYVLGRGRPFLVERPRQAGTASAAAGFSFDGDAAEARLLAKRSFVMPAIGLAVVTPLSLHFLVAILLGETGDMGFWILASVLIVGHAHIAFAGGLAWHAAKLASSVEQSVIGSGTAASVGLATLMATVPGVILLAIPPALTLVTGMVLAPLILLWIQSAARAEARALDARAR